MKKKENAPFGAGISSLLMLFVILCLTVFGVLAYMTAQADSRLSARAAETVAAYYQADSAAEELLAQTDEAVFSLSGETAEIQEALEALGYTVVLEDGLLTAEYVIPVDETRQYLLRIVFDQPDGSYRVITRQTEETAVWGEEDLEVWQGN